MFEAPSIENGNRQQYTSFIRNNWVLHIAKVGSFFLPALPSMEWQILGPLLFFICHELIILRFLVNCCGGDICSEIKHSSDIP